MKKSTLLLLMLLTATVVSAQFFNNHPANSTSRMEKIHRFVDKLNNNGHTQTSLAKNRQLDERLIAQSSYSSDTMKIDSSCYKYSGARSSYFSFNYMAFTNSYNLDGMYVFGFGSEIGFLDHNDNPSMLSDTTMIWGLNPFTFAYEQQQTWYMSYDSNSNISVASLLNTDSAFYANAHYENTFDANQNISSSVSMDWNGFQYDSTELRLFFYDANHWLTEDSTSIFDGTSWQPLEKWVYTRNVNGNVTLAVYSHFDGANWITDHRYQMTYFNGTNIITLTDQSYDGASWQTDAKELFAYNGVEPYNVSYTDCNYSGGVLMDSTIYSKRINAGLPDTLYTQYYDGTGVLYNKTFTTFQYDSYDEPTIAKHYYYNYTDSTYDSVAAVTAHYYYQLYQKPSSVLNRYVTDIVKVYPNPTSNKLYIDLPQTGEYVLILSDLYGRTLRKVTGSGTQILSTTSLASGCFILAVYDMQGNKIKLEKVIKQ